MRKSKNRNFYHIFVSPGDAPGAITLNVVWMERERDASKLSRCMCQSIYYRFWDTARYLWKKSSFYHTPLAFDAPFRGGSCRNIGTPFGVEKLEWCRYLMVKKFWRFVLTWSTNVTDRQTDRHCETAKTALASHRAVKMIQYVYVCVCMCRSLLDFDFEKLCSVSLSHINVYACLVCGKYFQGERSTTTLASWLSIPGGS